MGGFGSGRQGWLPVIEHGLKLDLRRLRKQGLFDGTSAYRSINLTWNNSHTGEKTASAGMCYSVTPGDSWLALDYTITRDGERIPVKDTFYLERFEQPFGGYRWYLRCPQTGRRCQCLYLPPGATHFRSRQGFRCRLQYRSQHHGPYDRLLDRRERVAAKVLRAGSPEWREKYRDWEIAPKPKGMRWAPRCHVRLMLEHKAKSALAILGSPDDLNFCSCLTLFRAAVSDQSDQTLFEEALKQFYDGKPDARTLKILGVE